MIGNAQGLRMPPATRNIIIINVIVWLAEVCIPGFGNTILRTLGLHFYASSAFNPLQIVTYAFVHDSHTITHVLFNMFTLWMFGRTLEMVWGTKRFLFFYFVCAIGAALVQEAVWAFTWQDDYIRAIAPVNGLTFDHAKEIVLRGIADHDPSLAEGLASYKRALLTVGASGAVFGLLLGFAFVFPNLPLYIMFIPVPIKAKYMVAGYAVIELFLGVSGRMDSVAHYAHLGGMIFALALLLWWKKKGTLNGRMNGF